MCDIDFDGQPEFHNKEHPTARKEHRCVVCRGLIKRGERYLRESYKWEGDVGSEACCLRCEEDINKFGAAHHGYPFASSFADFLVDCLDERDGESERVWRPMLERIEARRKVAAP